MDVPGALLTEVVPGSLWWGGALGAWGSRTDGPHFDVILACDTRVPDEAPVRNQLVLRWNLDEDALPDMAIGRALAAFAAHEMHLGQRVLIHGATGLERSALLVGMTLAAYEVSAPDCWGPRLVARLRRLRPGCLTTPVFRAYLIGE